jgi:hypothetical protein
MNTEKPKEEEDVWQVVVPIHIYMECPYTTSRSKKNQSWYQSGPPL